MAAQAGSSSPLCSLATPRVAGIATRNTCSCSCFWMGQKEKPFPGTVPHGMAWTLGASRCMARQSRGATATVGRGGTALLRKSLAHGARAPGRTAVLFLPSPLASLRADRIQAGWLRPSAPRYPRQQRCEELGPGVSFQSHP